MRVKVPACTPPEPGLPACIPAGPHSVFAPPPPPPHSAGLGVAGTGAHLPRLLAPGYPRTLTPPLLARQIVTLERELRQGQVCFSLEVSKESNLLLHSAADVSGASAPRARLRKQGWGRGGPRAAGARARAALECAFQEPTSREWFLELTGIFWKQNSALPGLCQENEMREYACYSPTCMILIDLSVTLPDTHLQARCTRYWFQN